MAASLASAEAGALKDFRAEVTVNLLAIYPDDTSLWSRDWTIQREHGPYH